MTNPSLQPVTNPSLLPVTNPSLLPVSNHSLLTVSCPCLLPVTNPSLQPVFNPSLLPVYNLSLLPVSNHSLLTVSSPCLLPGILLLHVGCGLGLVEYRLHRILHTLNQRFKINWDFFAKLLENIFKTHLTVLGNLRTFREKLNHIF